MTSIFFPQPLFRDRCMIMVHSEINHISHILLSICTDKINPPVVLGSGLPLCARGSERPCQPLARHMPLSVVESLRGWRGCGWLPALRSVLCAHGSERPRWVRATQPATAQVHTCSAVCLRAAKCYCGSGGVGQLHTATQARKRALCIFRS